MDNNDQNNIDPKPRIAGIVHVILSQDYALFFLAVVLGVVLDIFFPIRIFSSIAYEYTGLLLILIGTTLIYWAQSTSRKTGKTPPMERNINFFLQGPYKYTRNPTNFGLTLAGLGLALMINSLILLTFILVIYIISKMFFIKKQDVILKERYGSVFEEYSKKVKDWL